MAGVDRKIAQEFGVYFLDDLLYWIGREVEPDVVYDLGVLRDVVGASCTPGDVFSEDDLRKWALSHGLGEEA